jgi:hypothetical protein
MTARLRIMVVRREKKNMKHFFTFFGSDFFVSCVCKKLSRIFFYEESAQVDIAVDINYKVSRCMDVLQSQSFNKVKLCVTKSENKTFYIF